MCYQREKLYITLTFTKVSRVDYDITIEIGQCASRKSFRICKGWSNQERHNGKIQFVATYS